MIAIDRVTKRFADRVVLDDLTLHFERGQTLAICGPSGCGKSTLLRCIVGLERFDAGTVRVGDIALGPRTTAAAERSMDEAAAKIRLRVGLVLQHYGLFSHMTVLENVIEAPVHVLGMDPREARERASELLETVGVMHRRDAYPREMSGGEQQRVAIARALAMSPEALLLDEPTSALDAERKAAVVALLERVAVGGTTLILVTHEPLVVRELARRAILLRGGKVAADGTPGDVLTA